MYHHILLSTWYSDFLTTKDQKDNLLLAGEVLNLCNCCFKKIIEDVLAGILHYPGKR